MAEQYEATVEWLPFALHPEYPPARAPRAPGRAARGAALFERHGLTYNPPPVAPRSLDAQRLAEHARERDLYEPFFERTMDAYWAEARDIGDHDVLRSIAAEVGLDGTEEVLASDVHTERVRRSTGEAHAI